MWLLRLRPQSTDGLVTRPVRVVIRDAVVPILRSVLGLAGGLAGTLDPLLTTAESTAYLRGGLGLLLLGRGLLLGRAGSVAVRVGTAFRLLLLLLGPVPPWNHVLSSPSVYPRLSYRVDIRLGCGLRPPVRPGRHLLCEAVVGRGLTHAR